MTLPSPTLSITSIDLPVPSRLGDVFARFSAADLEVLSSFTETVRELQRSRFGQNLDRLGVPPRITGVRHRPGGGGSGILRVTHASPESRAAIFAASRRLRTEHEYGSFHQACRILKSSIRRQGSAGGKELGYRLEAVKRRVRDASKGPAAVAAEITDGEEKRIYATREEIRELAEYGHHFHQGDEVLRKDWLSVPESLLDPSVDEALRAAIEAAIGIYPIVQAVLAEPSLRDR